jgi:hypothetical protein
MTPTTVLGTVLGIALVAVALIDVYLTLLRPGGSGPLTAVLFRATWRVGGGARRRGAGAALVVLAVILLWVSLIVVGWALLYLPYIPEGYFFNGVDPARYHPFAEAITISLVTMTTLGFGDVVPVDPLLRVFSPLQGLIGFLLLSATVSWFTQLYPALARRRAFALAMSSMSEAGLIDAFDSLPRDRAAALLDEASASLAHVTADLAQNPEVFYFGERDPRLSMPRAAEYVLRLRDRALGASDETIRLQGRRLDRELEYLGEVMRRQYPHVTGSSAAETLGHVAARHGHAFDA